jgi:hypothetical protein
VSSTSASCGIGRPEAGPLIDALRDNSPQTRLAVLDALTRLSLEPDAWFEVREYVMWALGDETAPEHLDVIELATRVPTRSVRQRLVSMAERGTPEERRRAALALGRAGESQAAPALLALLDEEPAAAEALASIDASAIVDEVERRWESEGGLFLAVALARTGRGEALAAELERLSGDPDLSEEYLYTDELLLLEQALGRVGPLPDAVRDTVDRDYPGWFASHLVANVLFAAPAPETAAAAAVSVAEELPAEHRELVQDALGAGLPEHDVYQAEPVVELANDIYRPLAEDLDRRSFDSLLVSGLLERAAEGERQSGDDAVLLAGALGADYAPDVGGLFDVWQRCPDADELARNQIAWTAGRAPVPQLLGALGDELASDPEPTAKLIAAALSWRRAAEQPLTPAGETPEAPEPGAPTELLEDMLMAAPPPMAEPEMEAPSMAEPELAEANGGGGEPELAEANGGEEAEPPAAPEARWILVWVKDVAEPEQVLEVAFRAGAVHQIEVAIGPNQEGALVATGGRPFDEELGEVSDMEELTVTLLAPQIELQQSKAIRLPREGTSEPAKFLVEVPAELETFEAEVRIHHRNRAVQMARLSGPVAAEPASLPPGSRIELEVATLVPDMAELGTREGAHAGIVRTDAGTTAVADNDLIGFDDERVGRVVREGELLEVLTELATGEAARARKLEDAVDDLRALVFQGCELYGVIGKPLAERLGGRPLERLQVIVDERSDFFPLELVYDLPAPASDATLCPGWKAALRTGVCRESHEPPAGELFPRTFCPSGFWGVSKVIERRVVGADGWHNIDAPESFEIAIRVDPTTERDTLDAPREIVFAASSRVDAERKGGIESVRKSLERIAKTTYAETWEEWVEGVSRRPSLLVLLSHTTREQAAAALEIGDGRVVLGVQLQPVFVRASEEDMPVVLLLGCETAVTDELQSFVSRFQDLGAALVVGTTGSVLGQRAAPVARAVAAEFAKAAKRKKPIAAGDLVTSLRRKLLAKGELTALCLTAYGDAGWQVGGGDG